MEPVRDLLAAAATTVGWDIDLDQLPVTCAQVPTLVLTLLDVSAAHLAALAGDRMLAEAAESIRTVMHGAPAGDVDWEARLLTAVLDLTDARHHHTGRTRQRLTAALQALESEGATWPPQPPPATDTDRRGGLTAALTGLGLHPVPAAPGTSRITYVGEHGDRKVTVAVHPGDDNTAQVHVFDRDVVSWSATFTPATPPAVIVAAVRDALPATGTDRPGQPDAGNSRPQRAG